MKRVLTEEEEKLWRQVTRDDSVLRPARQAAAARLKKPVVPVKTYPAPAPMPATHPVANAELARGIYAGVDRATAERFRKGNYAFDATLDLHGLKREAAWQRLNSFINAQYAQGSRCLLVITGKGSGANGGILREVLPRWLAELPLRPMVLAFDTAQPRHGGSGATYVLLRRRR